MFLLPGAFGGQNPTPRNYAPSSGIVARMFVPRQIINGDYKSTPFPKLPIELCRMIWLKSLPGPRINEVQRWFGDECDFCYSHCPIPTALLVNREAREAALEFCKPCFAILGAPAEIYFDKEIDWSICFKKTFVGKARRQLVGLTARRFL